MKDFLTVEVVPSRLEQFQSFLSFLPNPDPLLEEIGESLEIYEKMLLDARISSLLDLRKNTALSFPFRIVPGDSTPKGREIADFVSDCFSRLNLYQELKELLSCLEFGFAVSEVVWELRGGWWIPVALKSRKQTRFRFKDEDTLVLVDDPLRPMQVLDLRYKFIIHRYGGRAENPYGDSVLRQCYWPWMFKKAGFRFWLTAAEKFGVPTVMAIFEADNEEVARKRAAMLAEALSGIQNDAAVALANVKEIETLEVKGKLSDFKELIECCNAEISYAITGQVLATAESQYGTRAQSQIHKEILMQNAKADAKQLAWVLNKTLIRWIVELNYGEEAPIPRFEFELEEYAHWDVVKDAIDRGIPVSKKLLYTNYRIPEPFDEKDVFVSPKAAGGIMLADDVKKKEFSDEILPAHLIQEDLKLSELESTVREVYYACVDEIQKTIERYFNRLKRGEKDWKPSFYKSFAEKVYYGLMIAFLLGMDHVKGDIELADSEFDFEPMSFKEAIDFLKQRIPMTKDEFEKLDKRLRFRAFAVARLTQLDAINAVKEKLQKVLEEGKTFKEFWEEGGRDELLQRAGFHESNPWYWESVFRTNIQSAYNAGRAMQIRRTRAPYLEFVGIRDSRQTEICRARSGVIRPTDDPWWKNNWPPLHIGCRSTVRPVYQEEKEAFGLRLTRVDALEGIPSPQEGFGGNPLDTGSFYTLTSRMIERAKQYGIWREIKEFASKLGIDESEIGSPGNFLDPIPMRSYRDIEKALDKYAKQYPEMFRRGFSGLELVEEDFVMATTQGRIFLNKRKFSEGFSPSLSLLRAFQKIRRGEKLTFHEELAVEALWHEILHNAVERKAFFPSEDIRRHIKETINEFIARHTYDEFLTTLGGSPSWKQKIIAEGAGYAFQVKRLRELMKHLDVDEEKIARRLKRTLLSVSISERDWKNVVAQEIAKLKEEEGWPGDVTALANSITLAIGEIFNPKYLHIPVISILRKHLPSLY